jgi:hypothetical protein
MLLVDLSMSNNYIVDEVHRIREEMLAEYGGDLRALLRDIRKKSEQSIQRQRAVPPQARSSERLVQKKKKTG